MSVTQISLLQYLNNLLMPELFDDYGPNGLQVEGKTDIKRVAFAVSATRESLEKSLAWKADALVVHHGIFWRHQGARTVTGPWGERVKQCVKHDLNLIAYHLPLDANKEVGNAVALGKEIGLTNLEPFGMYKKQPLGAKGTLPTPIPASDLRIKLTQILNHSIILASPDEKKLVHSIGIITGGANNEWTHAMNDKLDAYITGEISEYNWHDCIEAGLHFYAGGHHATEKFGIMSLMHKIKKDISSLDVEFFDSENPA